MNLRYLLSKLHPTLLLPLILLSLFGIFTLLSIDSQLAKQQLLFLSISLIAFILLAQLDSVTTSKFWFPIYVLSIMAILLPYFIGTTTRGTTRWITIGTLYFQPSVLSIPWLLLVSSYLINKHSSNPLKAFSIASLVISPPILLIFLQPDLGTSLVLLVGFLSILIHSLRLQFRWIIILAAIATIVVLSSPLFLKDYQIQRLTSFLNPSSDPLGSGYHVIQSNIAVGSGRLWGWGFGRGSQSSLRFLPASQTDFIFAAIAEEFGLLGAGTLIILYIILFIQIIKSSSHLQQPFSYSFVLSIFWTIFFQSFVNIGMNLGLAPITGITLPGISYGGSSLLAIYISLGLVNSLSTKSIPASIHVH